LAEKAVLYDQLLASTRQLVSRNDIIVKNETEIIKLRFEIDIYRLEINQKRDLLAELNSELEVQKKRYKELKLEISRLEKRVDQLTGLLR
jgi:predicted  nucleic acid-binding Zn-ribbon protein